MNAQSVRWRPPPVDDAATYRASGLACLLLLAIPFTQFGFGYWTSVQGAMLLLTVLFVRKNISHLNLLLFFMMALVMLASLLGHMQADTLGLAFLRLLRQIVCVYVIVCAAATISWRPKPYFFDVLLPLVILSLSGLVVAQYVSYNLFGWSRLFVPAEFFIAGFSTIADKLIDFSVARGFVASVRVSGTFAEPSYFGFVALSLAMLVFRGTWGRWRKFVLLGALMLALICSKSASGVPLFVLLVLFAYRRHLTVMHWFAIAVALVVGLLAAELLLKFSLIERLMNITDPVREESGYVRLILPLKHILVVLQHQPLGVPLSEFFSFTSHHLKDYAGGAFNPIALRNGVASGTDNAFLNLFISFGFGAVALIGLLVLIVKDKLTLVYLLFVAQFNGDIMGPDKAAIIGLVISCRRQIADAVQANLAKIPRFTPAGHFGAVLPIKPLGSGSSAS